MDERMKLITDGVTFLNRWIALNELADTEIYISASNYMATKYLLAESFQFLKDYPDKLEEYIKMHRVIVDLFNDKAIGDIFKEFLNSTDPYMETILLTGEVQNIAMVVFKGVQLDKQPGDEIDPTIEETVAYAEYMKQKGEVIPVFTMNDDIIEFCKEFNFDLDIRDVRID